MSKRKVMMSEIDLTILIEKDRRVPVPDRKIAPIVNRSHVSVGQRVTWLLKNGYIEVVGGKKVTSEKGKECIAYAKKQGVREVLIEDLNNELEPITADDFKRSP